MFLPGALISWAEEPGGLQSWGHRELDVTMWLTLTFFPCDLFLLGLVLCIYLKCSLLSPKVITVFLQRFSFFEFSLKTLAIEWFIIFLTCVLTLCTISVGPTLVYIAWIRGRFKRRMCNFFPGIKTENENLHLQNKWDLTRILSLPNTMSVQNKGKIKLVSYFMPNILQL